MPDPVERDITIDHVRPGDRLRYLGAWYDVLKVRGGVNKTGPIFGVTIDDRNPIDGSDRELVYMAGVFVAAEVSNA